jgi:LysR family transcriptional regulator, cyn operon transcriptional activator
MPLAGSAPSPASALALAARGIGDTIISLPLARYLGYTGRLHWVSLDPPLYETFAFITRHDAHLSPATRVLMRLASRHLQHLQHSSETLPGNQPGQSLSPPGETS